MSRFQIELRDKRRWSKAEIQNGTLYFAGYLYLDGILFTNAATLAEKYTISEELITDAIGEFSIIADRGQTLLAAVDKKKTIPLFYYQEGERWFVRDHLPESLMESRSLQHAAALEFIMTGYATRHKTLAEGVYQVEAAQIVTFGEGEPVRRDYFRFYHSPDMGMEPEDASRVLADLFREVFENLASRIRSKKVVIPLSGGYDSRIISLLLKDFGITDVKAFTYGKPGSPEAMKSREIADRIGMNWTIIPYDKKSWQSWYASDEWKNYRAYATNLSSNAHLQDWPAVKELMKNAEPGEHVFIPGHSGDFTAGSHIPYELTIDKSYTLDDIMYDLKRKHHRLWLTNDTRAHEIVDKEIIDSLAGIPFETSEQATAAYECWNWKERQAKFIINSVQVYNFYQQDWELPLWDDRFMEFFKTVPVKYRYKKYLYDYTLHQMYPDYFPKPVKKEGEQSSVRTKYGALYPLLKKAYNKKLQLTRYYNDPMEWYGISGSYPAYLNSLAFRYEHTHFKNPYNINSFLVKDYISQFKG